MPKLLAICFMLLKRYRMHKTCLVVVLDLIGMPRLPAEAKGHPEAHPHQTLETNTCQWLVVLLQQLLMVQLQLSFLMLDINQQ